jgi:hypothetical protein
MDTQEIIGMLAINEARMNTRHKEMLAWIKDLKFNGEETTVCQDAVEANLEKIEPNPGEKEAAVERQETSNEEVAINSLMACQNERTTCQEATKANPEKMEPIDRAIAILEHMIATTKANQETIATTDLKGNPEEMECEEPTSVDMTPEVAHEEVPKEDAVVMPVREPRKGVGIEEIWPRGVARRKRNEPWTQGVAGNNRT